MVRCYFDPGTRLKFLGHFQFNSAPGVGWVVPGRLGIDHKSAVELMVDSDR